MTPSETYEKLAKETDSEILARIYRQAAYQMRQKEGKDD